MVRVKICGITNLSDAAAAIDAGADALGFVFVDSSPRAITPQKAAAIISRIPPFVQTVGLFVNEDPERVDWIADFCGIDIVQLHGDEDPDYCLDIRRRVIKGVRVKDRRSIEGLDRYQVSAILCDAWSGKGYGGTGESFDWSILRDHHLPHPLILAGGLTPETVAGAVAMLRPWGVDVSSGVERSPGVKDHDLVRRFIAEAKGITMERRNA